MVEIVSPSGMMTEQKLQIGVKIMNTPLQKFKVIKGNQLVCFLMYQFEYTRKQAEFLESRMPGGFKVQVI